MNYKKVLEKLGFIEGKDFALNLTSFDMIQKSRMIPQIIHHPEVPATFDANGVELTPLIPAYDEPVIIHYPLVPAVLDVDGVTVLTPEISAYDEPVLVPELYTLPAPTQQQLDETWKHVQLSEADISLLISEYLAGKDLLRDHENDYINIVNGNIHSWNFTNIPQPTMDELVALIPIVTNKKISEDRKKALKDAGAKDRMMCENALNLITGFNRERVLTADQITQMQTTFSTIQTLLQAARPSSAKALIQAITPDEVLVTTEMKSLILDELIDA